MSGTLKGSPELKARIRALKTAFKPAGRAWADATASEAERRVKVRTGRLRRSIRVKNASQRRATVVGHFTANFEDAGAVPHTIAAKRRGSLVFTKNGRTIFAKKVDHPGRRARPFKKASAEAGLKRAPLAGSIVDAWNDAA